MYGFMVCLLPSGTPVLVELAKSGIVPVYCLNYKDERDLAYSAEAVRGTYMLASVIRKAGQASNMVSTACRKLMSSTRTALPIKAIGPVPVEAIESKILPLVKELQG